MSAVVRALLIAAALLASIVTWSDAALARQPREISPAEVALRELPPEARNVYERILAGGPFHYDRDGVVFGNREGLLPHRPRGYYHEYTVPTPGERSRGARRIVCGGPRTAPEVCFYSDDHYRSFRRIRT